MKTNQRGCGLGGSPRDCFGSDQSFCRSVRWVSIREVLVSEASDELGLSNIEEIKRNSFGLRGRIVEELVNGLPNFSPATEQVLKFHGIYNQDNRDLRSELKRAGLDLEHICMIRLALPGGRLNSQQYLAVDCLADTFGNGSLRVTTRQGIQFHFVTKDNVKAVIRQVNQVLISTYAGCGDVVRNVTACPSPAHDIEALGLGELADALSRRYKPASSAYFEVWMDGEKASTSEIDNVAIEDEPIYGSTYLPRKFKIGITSSRDNCVDVLSCDIGLVIDGNNSDLIKVFVGGGLGRSHADDSTKALLAQPLAMVARDRLFQVIDGIIAIQRDNGNRKDRAHARFKYLVEQWGTERIREELVSRIGFDLQSIEPHKFPSSEDHLGWIEQNDGVFSYGIKVPSGRISDSIRGNYKSAIKELVIRFGSSVRFSAKEDVILTDIPSYSRREFLKILRKNNVLRVEEYNGVSRNAFACPALPTCGLALAESERFLPVFLDRLNELTNELELDQVDLEVRMTGCPNGCARPYLGEIGIVGRSKRSYDIYLGADRVGNRLGDIYAIDVTNDLLTDALRPILHLFRKEAHPGEGFGDFCNRYGIEELRKYAPEPRRRRIAVS